MTGLREGWDSIPPCEAVQGAYLLRKTRVFTCCYIGGGLVRGAGGYGERVARQAEGIEVPPSRIPVDSGNQGEHGKAQRGPGLMKPTSGRGVAARSLGLTKFTWML